MREIVKTFKALSDDTRLRILNLLMERECCVCEVMQVLDISQSKASRHLSALYDAGFLQLRRKGLWSEYYIDKSSMKKYCIDLIKAADEALADEEIASRDRERLRKAERIGPSCIRQMKCNMGENI